MSSFRVLHISSPIRDPLHWSSGNPSVVEVSDHFHLPYPASPTAYLKACGLRDSQSSSSAATPLDRILQLPPEISDQILSLLSPSALDAARFTCRAWWDKIMSSCWILSQVLGVRNNLAHSRGNSDADEILRQLATRLDYDSLLISAHQHDDSWSARYRKYGYDFTLPKQPNAISTYDPLQRIRPISQHQVISTSFSSSSNMIAFLVREALDQDLIGHVNYSVAIYRIFLASRPVLIKSIACPKITGAGTPCQIRLLEVNAGHTWTANVLFSSQIASLSISLRRSFAKSESPYETAERFVFHDRDAPTASGKEQQHILVNHVGKKAPAGEAQWQLLECLPMVGTPFFS